MSTRRSRMTDADIADLFRRAPQFELSDVAIATIRGGARRRVQRAERHAARDSYPCSDPYRAHYIGAAGEWTWCELIGVRWDPTVDYGLFRGSLDAAGGEVRCTSIAVRGPYVKAKDADKARIVHVFFDLRRRLTYVLGWCTAQEARADARYEYADTGNVEANLDCLRPIESLTGILRLEGVIV